MLSESSFIESSIFDLESGFSIVESGFLKRESEHKSGFFPSPGFLRVRVQVRVRVRSGFRSMPSIPPCEYKIVCLNYKSINCKSSIIEGSAAHNLVILLCHAINSHENILLIYSHVHLYWEVREPKEIDLFK